MSNTGVEISELKNTGLEFLSPEEIKLEEPHAPPPDIKTKIMTFLLGPLEDFDKSKPKISVSLGSNLIAIGYCNMLNIFMNAIQDDRNILTEAKVFPLQEEISSIVTPDMQAIEKNVHGYFFMVSHYKSARISIFRVIKRKKLVEYVGYSYAPNHVSLIQMISCEDVAIITDKMTIYYYLI